MESYFVKKLSNGTVSYRAPGKLNARRWKGKEARLKIPYEELEEAVNDPAIRTLFDKGHLYVEEKDVRVRLGLEMDDGSTTESSLVLTAAELEKMLYEDDFVSFKEKFQKLARETKENLIDLAISSSKHAGYEKYDLIRKTFFVDVERLQRERREEKEG